MRHVFIDDEAFMLPPLNFNNSKTLGEEGDATPLAS
jgi:hypothetical protein